MSASYEERKALVLKVLEHYYEGVEGNSEIAEEILHDLDHIPENVGWVARGYTRDTT